MKWFLEKTWIFLLFTMFAISQFLELRNWTTSKAFTFPSFGHWRKQKQLRSPKIFLPNTCIFDIAFFLHGIAFRHEIKQGNSTLTEQCNKQQQCLLVRRKITLNKNFIYEEHKKCETWGLLLKTLLIPWK